MAKTRILCVFTNSTGAELFLSHLRFGLSEQPFKTQQMELGDTNDVAYVNELLNAQSADLTLVQGRQIVHVARNEDGTLVKDADGSSVVMLTPALIPKEDAAWEKAFQLFLLETKDHCSSGYRVIYIHSGFAPPLWFGWWLLGLRSRLSRAHRKNVTAVSVIHASLSVRLVGLVMRPFLGANFWEKLHYADRVEELWLDEILPEGATKRNLPQTVVTYEGKMVREAEVQRELAVMFGAPLLPREEGGHGNGQ